MASVPSSAIKLLLIDSYEGREYWAQRLKRSSPDYVVLEAATGAAALSICESHRIDCVVTEVALPDMSGFKVLSTLVPSLSNRQIPVIILTHNRLEDMAALAFKNGARGYLLKSHASGDDLDRAIYKAIAAVASKNEAHSSMEPQVETGGTVLVVDDDEADLKRWSEMVRRLPSNYTVLTARDCQSGVALCRERKIGCVLLDLDMPESGFRALLELIPDRERPDIPVIILSHLINPVLSELSKKNGARGFLLKQRTTGDQLATAIQQAMSLMSTRAAT